MSWVNVVVLGVIVIGVIVMFGLGIIGWIETSDVWNGGICKQSGLMWQVIEIDGTLYLDDGQLHRYKVGGLVVPLAITDALKRQREETP